MNVRKWHRRLGLWSAALLSVSAVTGMLWAYAPYLYWADGYKERKHPMPDISLAQAGVSFRDVIDKVGKRFGKEWQPQEIILSLDGQRLLYRLKISRLGKLRQAMLDASTGQWVDPLNRELAVVFARQYVAGKPDVTRADSLSEWAARTGKPSRPAWRVAFADSRHTEIFLDPISGEILEDQDDVRLFHFWIMRIHQLSFFGTRKELTLLNGLPLILLVLSGFIMGMRLRRGKPARKVTHSLGAPLRNQQDVLSK